MHELDILLTFAGGLAFALVFGFAARAAKLSPIVGYLLAGVLVGPFTPGYVANAVVAEQFAEIGVILLMFGIGLRFHLSELLAVWRVALPGAFAQSLLSTSALAVLLHLAGWSWMSGIILGMAVSVASTVVMAMVLAEHRDLHAPIGHIAIGWTVVEDLLTVVLLLLLPILFGPSAGSGHSVAFALGLAGLKVLGLVGVVGVLGTWVTPWLFERAAKSRSRELFTLTVLVWAVGIAVLSAKLFGVSMALGAFLAGLAVGRSEFAARAAGDALPMKDAFAVLFFVSVGMLFEPLSLLRSPLPIALVLLVVVVVKPVAAALTVRLLGRPFAVAVPVGAAFSQVGEFSFVLGAVARELGLINSNGWNALVAASIVSIALNPWIYRRARRWSSSRLVDESSPSSVRLPVDPKRCILVGFGPVGRIVHRILLDQEQHVTIIDLNIETIRELHAAGHTAVYGDALHPGLLDEVGVATAGSLILSADVEDAAEIVKFARQLNPQLRILARCAHLRDVASLRAAGATVVAAGEAEVGVALAEAVISAGSPSDEPEPSRLAGLRRRLYGSE